jgi:competence protein ComEA
MKPWQNVLLGILLGLLFAAIILLFILPQRGTPIPLVTITANPAVNKTPEIEQIKVELVGAVKQPGVYDFPKGIHLLDAIDLSGGVAEGADLSKINLALVLKDGQKITIPTLGSQNLSSNNSTHEATALLDINLATVEQLMDLPQIGEIKAQAIMTYRNDHGPFQKLEDLIEVPGVGKSIFEAIKSLITVNP